ncbi:metallophosphoesterase family protein [Phenylobacterium aquaticum]|uniref:metallophosphoesterase family protein n=1 Tax=Phenylobacterium aquaticum TaxID=1763816 RepID=UPI0026F21164|nr:metallophosphoesterase family protein [Phenylobacterium aquaticum]
MFSFFKRTKAAPTAPTTEGRLIYAIGDVHGRIDALEVLLRTIVQDARATAPAARPLLIFLGDYVDRGPASKEVVSLIIALGKEASLEVRALKGNHEEALLQFLDEPEFGSTWAEYGGITTLASYGVTPPTGRTDPEAWAVASQALAKAMPRDHLAFYNELELMAVVGDYAFVHAGVRPGVSLAHQSAHDLMWIRQEFLSSPGRFEKIIVHGHTPMEEPQMTKARIGVDTGVYATGILTAVRLDDRGATFLQAKVGYAPATNPVAATQAA